MVLSNQLGLATLCNFHTDLPWLEYTDAKRYPQQQLEALIAGSDREHQRSDVFHGGMGEERREAIKLALRYLTFFATTSRTR